MKELTRLKTITSKGVVFLSPFVFKEEEAKRRIKSASKTFERGRGTKTELLRLSKYPRSAVWLKEKHGKDKKTIDSLIEHIKGLESRWEVIENASDIHSTSLRNVRR